MVSAGRQIGTTAQIYKQGTSVQRFWLIVPSDVQFVQRFHSGPMLLVFLGRTLRMGWKSTTKTDYRTLERFFERFH